MARSHLIAVCVIFAAVWLPQTAHAQSNGRDTLEEIREALSDGDVDAIVRHSGDRIDLTVFGTSELLSRSQARYVVRSFFSDYPPARVDFVDTSESDGNWFASAGYWHGADAAPLSVYLRLRRGADVWELRELRFDRSPPR